MSIRKDAKTGIWQIDISIDGRPRYQRSSFTTNRKEAQELHDKTKTEIWRQVNLGEKPKYTWLDLVKLFLDDKQLNGKRSIEDDRDKLRWLHGQFDNGKMLIADINAAYIQTVLDNKRKLGKSHRLVGATGEHKPISNATINRYAALIHSMMQLAVDKEWISTTTKAIKLTEPKEKISYLTHEQASNLLNELPSEYVPLVRFSLATGLRQSNAVLLQWANVDLERKSAWVWSGEAKGKSDLMIPLNDDAVATLKSQLGKNSVYAFVKDNGEPFTYPNSKAFKSACLRAGISESFTWHDLRHTWATWHVMSGTPLEVLMKLGGWKSLSMVLKYAHLGQSHLQSHACNISLPPIAQKAQVIGLRA